MASTSQSAGGTSFSTLESSRLRHFMITGPGTEKFSKQLCCFCYLSVDFKYPKLTWQTWHITLLFPKLRSLEPEYSQWENFSQGSWQN